MRYYRFFRNTSNMPFVVMPVKAGIQDSVVPGSARRY
jgi:hypothetical protein